MCFINISTVLGIAGAYCFHVDSSLSLMDKQKKNLIFGDI